jgi:hypothetical protein
MFPLTYYVTHASPDYRQPIEPLIVVLGVVGVMGPSISDNYTLGFDESLNEEMDDERVAMSV